MRIIYGTTPLVGAAENHTGLALNGEQLSQPVLGLRAAQARHIARGNKSSVFTFGVERQFGTPERAERYRMQHWRSLPTSALLQCVTGTSTYELAPAVLKSVEIPPGTGCSLFCTYMFLGGLFNDGGPPIETDPLLDVIRANTISIPTGATSLVVTFAALAGIPHVPAPSVVMPVAGGARIWASPIKDTITPTGFTCEFSGPVPAGYFLSYTAIFA